MKKQLMKGNEAIVKSAILAGCRAFYGYPITPASEIAEAAAEFMPKTGGVYVQAESEVAAINMLYGGASAGVRVMTASSGPGISLMQEGISYMAGAELPCVIADITRAGPGLGNIGAEQGDYHQVVKGGGHGNYRTIVLAPHSVQEMADLTALSQSCGADGRRFHRPDDGAGGVPAIRHADAPARVGGGRHCGLARQPHQLAVSRF
jgi:pyruvate/2-oxoacid:ferredoxin oxidoreductase alpha subunit